MQYWPSSRWSYQAGDSSDNNWIELREPFALIGCHPRCQIPLDYKRLRSVVYLAVSCGSRVEIWPLCGISFPIWGRIRPETQITIGKQRLQFVSETDPEWAATRMSLPGDAINDVEQLQQKQPPAEATLVMDWGHGEKTRKLNRRVSVLGEEHPSTMRMHGLGLRACELGIVCIGTRVWAIQLNPETVPEEQPMVRELIPGGESTWVGDVHIWAGEKGVYSSSRFGNPPTGETHEAAVASTPSARHTDTNPPEKTPTPAVQVPEKVVVSSPSINDPSRTDAAERSLNADEIADHFTQRLLEKTEKRTNRESLIRWSATGGLLLSALLVAGYVLIRGVLPIFQAIYSE